MCDDKVFCARLTIFTRFVVRISYLAASLLIATACGGSSGTSGTTPTSPTTPTTPTTATPVATTSVNLSNSSFTPAAIVVSKGAVVSFTNQDNTAHNVTFNGTDGGTNIADFATGTKTSTMPNTAGTYSYRCTIHAGMNGTVTVQ